MGTAWSNLTGLANLSCNVQPATSNALWRLQAVRTVYIHAENLKPGLAVQGENTALHWSAMRGHVEIVKLLLQKHADRELHNKQGKLPIDLCQPNWSNSFRYTREVLAA